ncbi:protein EFR3 homolog cmp44E isoform X1 [Amyelois transitella]|uniref:protein EFR3 homolog cmp44E isoform X1 n=1 Tax=Amyelois transitella TaxID=680683 RepID=UPI00067CF0AE|nr:protein EFR3 homolog cmp44E isoform X1 [Amyelois transitella]XP_060807322.1 protein EFR3 homolog cmp44E isoform X1 [Amyelois transitella]XP_060807323.1 protein EFR3 homolog cmp44E isoform X1 [Amyelois transitella]XP_060807324.1 protein EFR3 homolog cmp44E isoform X1 [Amyelois transitella]
MIPLRKITHRTCFVISRTVYMTCCCGCCSALRPRYKRLVDNIFPASPQDGLVKTNMEKLTFYSLSSPEKLDRIGEYLFQKASRDIYRRRHGFVIIAMEAMDQLLLACHAQTLNLFVESFLKMVQKLLESTDPQLQTLATQSFVRFANIEEDTPSYHRRYDFFVSKFSAMCHSNHGDIATRDKIRLAGIQGLQGVIRKTVSDDLVENIWEAQHMDKIVPSLLYNMQTAEKYETVSCMDTDGRDPGVEDEPPRLAEACLRELVGRAGFGHIRSVLRPVLTHFDRHELWVPNEFAVHTFKIIMFSIQAQYSYSVVEALMQHLDAAGPGSADPKARTRVRAARAAVLSNIVAIAAGDSVGPSVLEIINNLLTNLRASVARDSEKETDEKLYQEALINALGEFADHLPDFQKIDIMMFIISKVPSGGKGTRADAMLQSILLKSLLKVGTTYKTTELSKAFPAAFLEALLRVSASSEPSSRALLQRILHTLLDRRQNADRLRMTVEYEQLGISVEKCSRQDLIFISKHGYAIFSSLYDGLQLESNTKENIEAIYMTLALLIIELASEETLCDVLQLIMAIQQSSISNPVLSVAQQCQLQALCVSLAALLPHVMMLPPLADYIHKIISARREEAPHLLPPAPRDGDHIPSAAMPGKLPYLMIDQMALCECLKSCGVDSSRLQSPSPYAAGHTAAVAHRHSWVEAGAAAGRDSLADITAGPVTELDSNNSSPTVQRHPMQSESVSLEALRRAATGPTDAERREAERKKATLNYAFRTAPFQHLVAMTQPKYELKDKLEEIFSSISSEPLLPASGACSPSAQGKSYQHHVPPYTKYCPDLFLY